MGILLEYKFIMTKMYFDFKAIHIKIDNVL